MQTVRKEATKRAAAAVAQGRAGGVAPGTPPSSSSANALTGSLPKALSSRDLAAGLDPASVGQVAGSRSSTMGGGLKQGAAMAFDTIMGVAALPVLYARDVAVMAKDVMTMSTGEEVQSVNARWRNLLATGRPVLPQETGSVAGGHAAGAAQAAHDDAESTLDPARLHMMRHFQDPRLRHLGARLSELGPAIAVDPSAVTVLRQPTEYIDAILWGIAHAKTRVTLSSPYLGTGEHELLIIDALTAALRANPELKVRLLLDANRATRPEASSIESVVGNINRNVSELTGTEVVLHADDAPSAATERWAGSSNGVSSSTEMLAPLTREFPHRVTVALFRVPNVQANFVANQFPLSYALPVVPEILPVVGGTPIGALPSALIEALGASNLKVCVFDNDVLLTGGDLSSRKDTFTTKQDRYMHVAANDHLASWYDDLVSVVSDAPGGGRLDGTSIVDNQEWITGTPKTAAKGLPAKQVRGVVSGLLEPLLMPRVLGGEDDGNGPTAKAWAFPTLQLMSANVRHDEQVMAHVLSALDQKGDKLAVATGHGNLADEYQAKLLLEGDGEVRILTAAPDANDSVLPLAYSELGRRLYGRILGVGFGGGAGASSLLPPSPSSSSSLILNGLDLLKSVVVCTGIDELRESNRRVGAVKAAVIQNMSEMADPERPFRKFATADMAGEASAHFDRFAAALRPTAAGDTTNEGAASRPYGVGRCATLHEYDREGWTFEAKGLWASLAGKHATNIVAIGSSNMGRRSLERDFESQVLLLTEDERLGKVR